jgi:hypothetical protein
MIDMCRLTVIFIVTTLSETFKLGWAMYTAGLFPWHKDAGKVCDQETFYFFMEAEYSPSC